jgi:hypothetical protein
MPKQKPIAPLTDADMHDISVQLNRLKDAEQLMDRAESAGVNCSVLREVHGQVQAALNGLVTHFGPQARSRKD